MACQEEYRSGKFDECPNCECTEPGTTIYKCKEVLTTSESDHCGKVFCNECGKITLMSFGHGGNEGCPSCGSFGSMIGEIKQEASEYDTEESEPDDDPDDSDSSYSSYDSSSTSPYSSSHSSGSTSVSPASPSSSFGFFEFILVIAVIFADLTILSRCSSDKSTSSNQPHQEDVQNKDGKLVTPSSIGSIRLGMSLDEARKVFPNTNFERTSDGEGMPLVIVKSKGEDQIVLYANEENAQLPIQWANKIIEMETFNPAYHTSEGVHPGSAVIDAEKIYGKTMRITKSEIESREFIEFDKQPNGMSFQLDYSGIFTANSRNTTLFKPGAQILGIYVTMGD